MNVEVHVSALLRHASGGKGKFAVQGNTIREIVEAIAAEYPEFSNTVLEPDGGFQRGVLVSINGELIQADSEADAAVQSGDTVSFLKAVAGG